MGGATLTHSPAAFVSLSCVFAFKCDLPGSGKAAKEIGVLAPLRGPTSNDSHKELTGMSRKDFAKYVEACMHPAPPDVVAR